ncbi:hypothetical protein BJ165DRAFT_1073367 [Panaeolus papilionaceus]|nr:hypothetical protein BJ165DRAFT_1073367 [Panaeolus papilionaceus]
MNELFDGVWKDKQSMAINNCSARSGQSITWENDDEIPTGHKTPSKNTIQIVSKGFIIPLVVPKWALGLTKRTEAVDQAMAELRAYFLEMIHRRRLSEKVEPYDLFGILLEMFSDRAGKHNIGPFHT